MYCTYIMVHILEKTMLWTWDYQFVNNIAKFKKKTFCVEKTLKKRKKEKS
jgi:hypothetical protein